MQDQFPFQKPSLSHEPLVFDTTVAGPKHDGQRAEVSSNARTVPDGAPGLHGSDGEILRRLAALEGEVSKASSFLSAMHTWALGASKSLRAMEEKCNEAWGEASRLRFEITQLSAQQEATSLALDTLQKEVKHMESYSRKRSKGHSDMNSIDPIRSQSEGIDSARQDVQSGTSGN